MSSSLSPLFIQSYPNILKCVLHDRSDWLHKILIREFTSVNMKTSLFVVKLIQTCFPSALTTLILIKAQI
ncbi:hypothetical protein NC651_002570 [Populus alba x Populus x berolinensis]|nr:hypothetical protein NC651_002570 [Populus alba x Populus x berolinensis]